MREWLGDRAYYRMQLDQRDRQPGSADRRGSRPVHHDQPRLCRSGCSARSSRCLVHLILWTLSGALSIPLGGERVRHPRLHGVRRIDLCGGRHLDHPLDRPAAGPAQLRPAALRGGFPLQHGQAARKCRKRRVLRRRSARTRRSSKPLRPYRRQLVGDHPPPQKAGLVHHGYRSWRSFSRSWSRRRAISPRRSSSAG